MATLLCPVEAESRPSSNSDGFTSAPLAKGVAMPTVMQESDTRRADAPINFPEGPPGGSRIWTRTDSLGQLSATAIVPGDLQIWAWHQVAPEWSRVEYLAAAWWLETVGLTDKWTEVQSTEPARLGSEPTAELIVLPHNTVDHGTEYVKVCMLGTNFHLSIADAVELVDVVASALALATITLTPSEARQVADMLVSQADAAGGQS